MNAGTDAIRPANRLGLDYAAEARRLGPPVTPIIDVHTHIGGDRAAQIFKTACDLYGVQRIYSMTHLEQVPAIQRVLGDRVRFIAVPNYAATEDRAHHFGRGFVERIERFHELGCRIVKFWVAPRSLDVARELGDPDMFRLNAPARLDVMAAAAEKGMMFMTHVGDPDTWFATKYADASLYGTKRSHYEPLEEVLERFRVPWIAAHMGGWPEDLAFLDGLLSRHANLHLDTSATKWMVRELSRHSRADLLAFLERWHGRILFGSDIVTTDDHLDQSSDGNEMTRKAGSEREAFDLYASRYWALRTLFETSYEGESPIADPDLAMVDPDRYNDLSAPILSGKSLPPDLLKVLYHDAAAALLDPLHEDVIAAPADE